MTVLDRFRLDGKVAVVTGAGRGIGAGCALAMAEAGADVLLSARTESQLSEVAQQVEALGRRAVVVPADLSDLDQVAALAQRAYDDLGRLDVVVNNVGGTIPNAFLDTTPDYLEEAFRFNVSTAHALSRAAVPLMLASADDPADNPADNPADQGAAPARAGSIVNISSVMGRVAGRGYLAYGTAKAALSHWTRLAARDLDPHITVNAIAVGSVMTSALEFVAGHEETRHAMEDLTPLRRIGEVEDIAATALWLASRAGGYVTGKVIEVDGGLDRPNLDLGLPDLTVKES